MKGQEEILWVMDMFAVLVMAMVLWVRTYVKLTRLYTSNVGELLYVCQLCLNKIVEDKKKYYPLLLPHPC